MKKITLLLFLIISIQIGYGQACGIYRINYVGKIVDETFEIKSIKLPTSLFLHGNERAVGSLAFVEFDLTDNGINCELTSHLTSHLYSDPNFYLELYRKNVEAIPVIIFVEKGIRIEKIVLKISWEEISIKMIEDEKFGELLQINLGEINLEKAKAKNG